MTKFRSSLGEGSPDCHWIAVRIVHAFSSRDFADLRCDIEVAVM